MKNVGIITPKNNLEKYFETLDILNPTKNDRNLPKEENENFHSKGKTSLIEILKMDENNENINSPNNKSLQHEEICLNTNLGILNRSLDEINSNIDSLYSSLNLAQNNLFEDLTNSKNLLIVTSSLIKDISFLFAFL